MIHSRFLHALRIICATLITAAVLFTAANISSAPANAAPSVSSGMLSPGIVLAGAAYGPPCGDTCKGDTNSIADGVTETIANEAGNALSQWITEKVYQLVHWSITLATTKTTPNVAGDAGQGDWFAIQYQMMMNVGWWLMLPLIFVTIIHSILKGSMSLLLRSIGMYLPLAVLGTVIATNLIQLLILIVDDVCLVFVNLISADLVNFMTGLEKVFSDNGLGIIMGIILGGVLALFAMYLWLIFLLRDASVYLAVMFMPVGFAMMVWPMAARYFRKMVEFLVGIILSKLVMVIIVSLSVAALAGSTGNDTAGIAALYPNGSAATTDNFDPGPDGVGGTADDQTNEEAGREEGRKEWEAFWLSAGYVFPAIVMLGLAALSPPMTIRLIGNMGLGEMAGQVADTLNHQGWLYQFIGAERWRRVLVGNPRLIADRLFRAGQQRRELRLTSQQEQWLERLGIFRNAQGNYQITREMLEARGVNRNLHDDIIRVTDPNNVHGNANHIAAAWLAYMGGDETRNILFTDTPGASIVVQYNDNTSTILMDGVDPRTMQPVQWMNPIGLRRAIDEEAQRQIDEFGSVQGIRVLANTEVQLNPHGRYTGRNRQQERARRRIRNIINDATAEYGPRITAQFHTTATIADMAGRHPHDVMYNEVQHPRERTNVGTNAPNPPTPGAGPGGGGPGGGGPNGPGPQPRPGPQPGPNAPRPPSGPGQGQPSRPPNQSGGPNGPNRTRPDNRRRARRPAERQQANPVRQPAANRSYGYQPPTPPATPPPSPPNQNVNPPRVPNTSRPTDPVRPAQPRPAPPVPPPSDPPPPPNV